MQQQSDGGTDSSSSDSEEEKDAKESGSDSNGEKDERKKKTPSKKEKKKKKEKNGDDRSNPPRVFRGSRDSTVRNRVTRASAPDLDGKHPTKSIATAPSQTKQQETKIEGKKAGILCGTPQCTLFNNHLGNCTDRRIMPTAAMVDSKRGVGRSSSRSHGVDGDAAGADADANAESTTKIKPRAKVQETQPLDGGGTSGTNAAHKMPQAKSAKSLPVPKAKSKAKVYLKSNEESRADAGHVANAKVGGATVAETAAVATSSDDTSALSSSALSSPAAAARLSPQAAASTANAEKTGDDASTSATSSSNSTARRKYNTADRDLSAKSILTSGQCETPFSNRESAREH